MLSSGSVYDNYTQYKLNYIFALGKLTLEFAFIKKSCQSVHSFILYCSLSLMAKFALILWSSFCLVTGISFERSLLRGFVLRFYFPILFT